MEKRVFESNPISSYVQIDGNQLYVTNDGQNFTCKYCGNEGHKQIDGNKRAKDFRCSFKIKIFLFLIQILLVSNIMNNQLLSAKKLFNFPAIIIPNRLT